MNSWNRYFGLMALLFCSFFGLIALLVVLFYVLKLFSIAFFNIPGIDNFYGVFVILVPYTLFFAGYYFLAKKIAAAKTSFARIGTRFLLVAGSLLCFVSMILSLLVFFQVRKSWLKAYDENSQYALILQIVILIVAAGILATGDAREKHWLERNSEPQS